MGGNQTQFKVVGEDELIKSIRNLADERIRAEVGNALVEAANLVAEDAKGRVPVRMGALRESIRKRVSKKKLFARVECDYPKGTGKYVRTKKHGEDRSREHYYAFAVEYGTRKDPEQPFLRPAKEAQEGAILEKVGAALERAIEG